MSSRSHSSDVEELSRGFGEARMSFLMPVFEQKEFIAEAVRSILHQRGPTMEIIISDDASSDETALLARATVLSELSRVSTPHRILLRRGRQRLWRNHLPLLVEMASCDIVCQAHGDDISLPDRANVLLAGFERFPEAAMVSSGHHVISGRAGSEVVTRTVSQINLTTDSLIWGHPNLIGCNLSWKRSAMRSFPRLDTTFSAVAHDRILAFRAFLSGSVLVLEKPLVKRRDHIRQAHRLSFEERDPTGLFGWSVTGLSQFDAMRRDLAAALHAGLIGRERHDVLTSKIIQATEAVTADLVLSFNRQTVDGLHIAWLDRAALLQRRGL